MLVERCPETHQRYTNVIRMRTAKIRNWELLGERTKNSIYVKYEDLNTSPEAFINTVSERFKLVRTPSFKDVQGYKGNSSNFRPKAYDAIKEEDLHYILNQLDLKLEESIGYDVKTLAATRTPRPSAATPIGSTSPAPRPAVISLPLRSRPTGRRISDCRVIR